MLPIVLAKFYKEGSNVNLFCSLAEGDRQASINYEWLKDNQRLRIDPHHNARLSFEQDSDKSILKVTNVQASDAGNYSCLVKNRYGKDSVTVQLRVKGKFQSLGVYNIISGGPRLANTPFTHTHTHCIKLADD